MSSHGDEVVDTGAAEFFGNERFELEERLGEGAYGVVYQAYDRLHETRVALKVLRALGPDALFYFKKEFRALSDLRHPNLVQYHELFEQRGRWFLTMELVHGVSFVEYVRAGRSPVERRAPRFDEQRLRRVLPQLVSALATLHGAGKVHRDVKPSNVRVTATGRLVLLDFGLVLDADSRESTRLPRVGTAAFMAPEQVVGTEVGPEADYYAVGALLYECLTGQHPFVGDAFDVLYEKQVREPSRASEVAPFVPLDLDELTSALLARDPKGRASGIEALRELLPRTASTGTLTATGKQGRAPFVGRTRELAILRQMVAELDDGPKVAFVHGEPGVGKSALLAEFIRMTREERPDAVILSGRCYERETVPYKAFDGVIDALARQLKRMPEQDVLSLLPPHVELAAQVFPVLARVACIRDRAVRERLSADRSEGTFARRRAFFALKELFARLARRVPLIITIDDVHRADVDSLALLEELLVERDVSVLFVLLGRAQPRGGEPWGAGGVYAPFERIIERVERLTRLRLGALPEADGILLAEALLREHGAPVELAPTIAREAAGQPLFVTALVHFVCQADRRTISTLDDVLRASLSGLSGDAQALVTMVALASAPLSRDVLARALSLEGGALSRALDEALSTGWFRMAEGEVGDGVELVHERVRESIVGRLEPAAKARVHRRLAEVLSRSRAHAEAAAFHWALAGAHDEVVKFARLAAEHAIAALAFGRAVRLFELSLEHVRESDRALRAELTEGLAAALSYAGRSREAAVRYEESANFAPPDHKLLLRHRAASEWLSAGEETRGIDGVSEVLAELGVRVAPNARRLTLPRVLRRMIGYPRSYRVDVTRADDLDPRELLRVDALYTLSTALAAREPRRAQHVQLMHLDTALALGEPVRLARALALEAFFVRGPDGGHALFESEELRYAKELAEQTGEPQALALVELAEALAFCLLGRYRDAGQRAEAAEAHLRDDVRGARWEHLLAQYLMLSSSFDAGEFRELSERLRLWARKGQGRDPHVDPPCAVRFFVRERLIADEPDEARALLERARAARADTPEGEAAFSLLCAQTELDLYLGDPNACARVERAWPELERMSLFELPMLRARAPFLRARAALGSGYLLPHQRPRLCGIARRQAKVLARSPDEGPRAWALMVEAAVLELENQRERALALFGEAALSADACHMPHYAATARRRQGTLLGGEEGRTMVVRAERFLREQGAVDPGRVCALLLGY